LATFFVSPSIFYYTATALFSLIIDSCRKDVVELRRDITGDWTWAMSKPSTGMLMSSDSARVTYTLTFKNGRKFSNNSACIIGGPAEGIFEVKKSGEDNIIILKAPNNMPDTFEIIVDSDRLTLIEIYDSYSWYHRFYRN
jgi:hypothetical protein